jgi:hypothetical protein
MTIGLFLSASGFQQSPSRTRSRPWIKFESKEGAFSVLMPEQPVRESQQVQRPIGTIESVSFKTLTLLVSYQVSYVDLTYTPSGSDEIDKVLDNARDGGLAMAKAKLISETRITLDNHPGREVKAKLPDGSLICRFYLVGPRIYIILIAAILGVPSADVARFFNSFKLIPDKPVANQPDWLEFAVPEGGFTILMPGKPDKQTIPVTIPGEETSMYLYSFKSPEGAAFIASYSDMKLDLDGENKVKSFLDGVMVGQVKSNEANMLLTERLISLGGYRGREFTIKTPAGINTCRVYLVGNRVYQIFFVKPDGYRDGEKSGPRFLDSFKLTKR